MATNLGLDQVTAQLERFAKLPRTYRIAALPLLCALVFGAYGYGFYRPAQAELAVAEQNERDLQRKVSEVRAIVSNLDAFEQELADMEQQLTLALRQLPDSKELPVLLTDISTLGKDAGLEFRLFRPQAEVRRDFYAEVPIEIEFSGGYHDVARFFDKVSKLPRIVNVSRMQMKPVRSDSGLTVLTVSGQATTFRFIDQPAVAPEESGTKSRRGRSQRSAAGSPRGGRS